MTTTPTDAGPESPKTWKPDAEARLGRGVTLGDNDWVGVGACDPVCACVDECDGEGEFDGDGVGEEEGPQ